MRMKITTEMTRDAARHALKRAGATYELSEQEIDMMITRSRCKHSVVIANAAALIRDAAENGRRVATTEEAA